MPPRGIARFIREPFCGLSHLVGAVLSVIALVVLLVLADGRPWHVVSFAIYGASLIVLFTSSGLAHSLHCSVVTEAKLDRLDYAAIFLLIAGTTTPLCLVTLRGPWGWSLLTVEWTLAAMGVCAVLFGRGHSDKLRTGLYLVMAWLNALVAPALIAALPRTAIWLLLTGGVIYTIGAAVFVLNRPRLWPGRFGSHDLWHLLVLLASACHFLVIANYVA